VNNAVALILRHSQRNEPSPWDVNGNMELTTDGLKAAYIFGQKMRIEKQVRIHYSPVTRCEETAKQIFKGFSDLGGNCELVGPSYILRGIGLDKERFIDELKKHPIHLIMNRWIAGLYPKDKWPSFQDYSKKAAKIIWNKLEKFAKETLSIYVTHDIHLMIMRFGWFGIPICEEWINYLDGFAFSFENDKIKLLDSGKIIYKEIPYWWNK
jgi:hypothetical protein